MEKERGKTLYFRSSSIANKNVFHGIKITAAFFRHPTLTTDSIFFRARFDQVSSMRSYSLALNRGNTEEKNSYRNVFESDENGTIFISTSFPWKVKIWSILRYYLGRIEYPGWNSDTVTVFHFYSSYSIVFGVSCSIWSDDDTRVSTIHLSSAYKFSTAADSSDCRLNMERGLSVWRVKREEFFVSKLTRRKEGRKDGEEKVRKKRDRRGRHARRKDTRVTRPDEKCQKLQERRLRGGRDAEETSSAFYLVFGGVLARRGGCREMKGETNRENETKPAGNAINRPDGRRRDSWSEQRACKARTDRALSEENLIWVVPRVTHPPGGPPSSLISATRLRGFNNSWIVVVSRP